GDPPQTLTDGADPQVVAAVVQEAIASASFGTVRLCGSITQRTESDQQIVGPHAAGRVFAEAQGADRIAGWIDLLKLVVGRVRSPVQTSSGSHPQRVRAVDINICDGSLG